MNIFKRWFWAVCVPRQLTLLSQYRHLFSAVTGLTFKEGVCYGKPESALLFAAFPILLLGHLTALMPADAEAGCAVGIAALFALFAARKYTQVRTLQRGCTAATNACLKFTMAIIQVCSARRPFDGFDAGRQHLGLSKGRYLNYHVIYAEIYPG